MKLAGFLNIAGSGFNKTILIRRKDFSSKISHLIIKTIKTLTYRGCPVPASSSSAMIDFANGKIVILPAFSGSPLVPGVGSRSWPEP